MLPCVFPRGALLGVNMWCPPWGAYIRGGSGGFIAETQPPPAPEAEVGPSGKAGLKQRAINKQICKNY